MRPRILAMIFSIALTGTGPAFAQKATEQYIPLGVSPGLSRVATDIGRIEKIDPKAQNLNLEPASGGRSVTVTERTRIWVDRSRYRLATKAGTFDDLRVGRLIEVKYRGSRDQGRAEWIKVIPESPQ